MNLYFSINSIHKEWFSYIWPIEKVSEWYVCYNFLYREVDCFDFLK